MAKWVCSDKKGAWSGIGMGPKPMKALCWGIQMELEEGPCFSLGLHTMVFQVEKYVIKACIMENMEKG